MNGLHYALRRTHAGELEIHQQLLRLADEHQDEHEVHHVTRELAAWSAEHVHRLAGHARRLNLQLDEEPEGPDRRSEGWPAAATNMTGRQAEPGLVLLNDLRDLYLQASDNSLAWEMLAQIAQAQHERELLALTESCHPQNLRQLRWANTMIKTQSPQILASL
jgi:hypothetical protein